MCKTFQIDNKHLLYIFPFVIIISSISKFTILRDFLIWAEIVNYGIILRIPTLAIHFIWIDTKCLFFLFNRISSHCTFKEILTLGQNITDTDINNHCQCGRSSSLAYHDGSHFVVSFTPLLILMERICLQESDKKKTTHTSTHKYREQKEIKTKRNHHNCPWNVVGNYCCS